MIVNRLREVIHNKILDLPIGGSVQFSIDNKAIVQNIVQDHNNFEIQKWVKTCGVRFRSFTDGNLIWVIRTR